MIEIENLCKSYNKKVLANKNINLDIKNGTIVGILGPNGAGKTTLVKQISGLLRPDSGDIKIDGISIVHNKNITKKYIGYQGQQAYIFEALTIYESVYNTGLFRGLYKKEAKEQAEMLIDYFSLIDSMNKRMSQISGGQKRIVSIISALIGLKPIIIFDEPTNDLDPVNRDKFWNIVKQINSKFGVTFIVVSHNTYEIENVITDLVLVDKGKILKSGNLIDIKNDVSNFIRMCVKFSDSNEKSSGEILSNICNENSLEYSIEDNTVNIKIYDTRKISNIISLIEKEISYDYISEMKIYKQDLLDIYLQNEGEGIN